MKNTIAIGIPDKVSEKVNEAFAKVKFGKDNFGSIKNFTRSTKHEKKKRDYRTKVIEFDLPKGYSANDAYWTGKSWITQLTPKEWSKDFQYIKITCIEEHFGIDVPIDDFDYGNLLLLLAVANGHKLE